MYYMGSRFPHGKGQFFSGGENRCPTVKYGILYGHLCKKQLNRSRRRLVVGSKGPKESCGRWRSRDAEDVAMATNFWLSLGHNFGCIIASDTLFDSSGGFSGSSYPMKT